MHYAVVVIGEKVEAQLEPFRGECWDWYEIGGRWSDFFILNNGSEKSASTIEEINWNEMDERGRNCYAIIKKGQWIETASLGFHLIELDPKTKLTIVDCHN